MHYEFEGDKPFLIPVYSFIMLIGLALAAWGVKNVFSTMEFIENGIHTRAHVRFERSDNNSLVSILQFQTQQGDTIQIRERHNAPLPTLGNEIEIIYEDLSPYNYGIASENQYESAVILLALATPFLVVSIGYFCFLRFLKKL